MKNATRLFILLAVTTVASQTYADQCVEIRSGDTLRSLKRRAGIKVSNSMVVDANLNQTWGVVRFTDESGDSHRKHFSMDKVGGSAQLRSYAKRYGARRGWTLTNTKFGLRHDRGSSACVALAIPANPCLAPMAQCTGAVRELQARKGVAPSQTPSQVAALQTEIERARQDVADLKAEREAVIRERDALKAKLAVVPQTAQAAKLMAQLEAVRTERNQLADELKLARAQAAELNSALAAAPAAQKRTADSGERAEDNLRKALAMGERVTGMLEQAKECHAKDGTRYDFDRHDCVAIASVAPFSSRQMWALGIGAALVLGLLAHAEHRGKRGQRGMEKFELAFHQMRDTLQALCGIEGNGHTQIVGSNSGEPTPERFDTVMRRIRAEAGRFKRMVEDATSRLRIVLASLEPDDEKRGELLDQYRDRDLADLVTKAGEVMSAQVREIEELRAARPAEHTTQPVEPVEAVAEVTDDGGLLAQMAELQTAHDALESERDSARQDVERLAKALADTRQEIERLTAEYRGADSEAKLLRRQLEFRSGAVVGQEAARRITGEIEAALEQIKQSADMRAAAARRGHVEQGLATLRRVTQDLLAVVTPAAS